MPTSQSEVLALPWREFLLRERENWHPGQHWAIVAPTGEGKSTFTGGLVQLRRYVLIFDLKGGDGTLSQLRWERITKWPLSGADRKKMRDGEPVRRIVGGLGRSPAERAKRRSLFVQVLEGVLQEGGWTVVIPDLAILTDRRFGAAGDQVTELLLLARDAKVSVITEFQRPAGIPREAGDQASYLAVAYTRDVDAVGRLSEMMGRSRSEIRGAVAALGELPYGWLIVSRRPREPILLTKPPKL